MEQVLQDLNLKAYTKTFIDQKITPDEITDRVCQVRN